MTRPRPTAGAIRAPRPPRTSPPVAGHAACRRSGSWSMTSATLRSRGLRLWQGGQDPAHGAGVGERRQREPGAHATGEQSRFRYADARAHSGEHEGPGDEADLALQRPPRSAADHLAAGRGVSGDTTGEHVQVRRADTGEPLLRVGCPGP